MTDNNIFSNNPFAEATRKWNENAAKAWNENAFCGKGAFDFSKFSDIQRRNIEVWTEANKILTEGVQAAARRQAEIGREIIGDSLKTLKEVIASGSPEASAAKQADLAKSLFESAVANTSEQLQLASKYNLEALDLINQRMAEVFGELGDVASSAAAKKKKAA